MPEARYQLPNVSPANPTITDTNISIDLWLKNPQQIERRVSNLAAENFLSPYLFAQGPRLTSGSIIFDTLLVNDLYLSRGQRTIAEGAEYPLVDGTAPAPSVAIASKFGGQYEITYEAQRRNRIDVMARIQAQMANDQVRKVDTDAMALFDADPNITANAIAAAGNGWGDATNGNIFADIATATSFIRNTQLGYSPNTVLVNPATTIAIMSSPVIRAALPRENTGLNPILSTSLNGLFGLNWIESVHVPLRTAYVMQRGVVGTIADEVPYTVRRKEVEERDVSILLASRTTAMFITDPLAAVRINGV